MTIRNTVAYGGISLDRVTKGYFNNVKFQGSYASGGSDVSNSKKSIVLFWAVSFTLSPFWHF